MISGDLNGNWIIICKDGNTNIEISVSKNSRIHGYPYIRIAILPVCPENSSQLILLKKLVYRAMLQTYELCVFFHDHFLDGRIPLPTVPAA